MPNEEYQRLLRADARELRERLEVDVADLDDAELLATFRDLGGHDLGGADRRLPPGRRVRDRPTRRLRLHDQGLVAADRGPPGQPLGAAQRTSSTRELAADARRRTPTTRGRRSRDGSPEAELCAATGRAARARRRPRAVAAAGGAATTSAASTRGTRVHPAGVRALLRRPRARGARGRRRASSPSRPTSAPRPTSAAGSTRPGIWALGDRIDWFADDTDTLVRWRESDHGRHIELGIAEVNLVGAARRARRDVVARRPAAAAGRHDLRPVRRARARAVVVRHLRRRAVDPRRHAERRHARPRGRRAPVGDHAVDRDRAARLRRLGARLRPGLRVDASCTRCRSSAGRAARAPTSGSRRARSTRRCTPGTREEALAGGYRLRAARRRRRWRSR